jgi:8-oxo-dGTP diphosphatase
MSNLPTKTQISSGGVAFRRSGDRLEIALISVGNARRWQLPKGLVNNDESNEIAAMREVREEAGIKTELVAPIDIVEYWYISNSRGQRVRFHKFVHFFLLRYISGDVADHDDEVNEARWVEIGESQDMLTFSSEKKIVRRAIELIEDLATEKTEHSL